MPGPGTGPRPGGWETLFYCSPPLVPFRRFSPPFHIWSSSGLNFVKLFWVTPLWGPEISQISFRTFTDVPPTLPSNRIQSGLPAQYWLSHRSWSSLHQNRPEHFLPLSFQLHHPTMSATKSVNKSHTGESGVITNHKITRTFTTVLPFCPPVSFLQYPTTTFSFVKNAAMKSAGNMSNAFAQICPTCRITLGSLKCESAHLYKLLHFA